MKFFLLNKTNKYKSTEIWTSLPLKLTKCVLAMQRSKKGLQKVPILKKTTGHCLFSGNYSRESMCTVYVLYVLTEGVAHRGVGDVRRGADRVVRVVIELIR